MNADPSQPLDETTVRLVGLCELYLRSPLTARANGGAPVLTFVPPLSAPEQTTYNRLLRVATSAVPGITPAEWLALENDIAGLVTFQNLPTPTLPQTVLAVKAHSRLWKAILRS